MLGSPIWPHFRHQLLERLSGRRPGAAVIRACVIGSIRSEVYRSEPDHDNAKGRRLLLWDLLCDITLATVRSNNCLANVALSVGCQPQISAAFVIRRRSAGVNANVCKDLPHLIVVLIWKPS